MSLRINLFKFKLLLLQLQYEQAKEYIESLQLNRADTYTILQYINCLDSVSLTCDLDQLYNSVNFNDFKLYLHGFILLKNRTLAEAIDLMLDDFTKYKTKQIPLILLEIIMDNFISASMPDELIPLGLKILNLYISIKDSLQKEEARPFNEVVKFDNFSNYCRQKIMSSNNK